MPPLCRAVLCVILLDFRCQLILSWDFLSRLATSSCLGIRLFRSSTVFELSHGPIIVRWIAPGLLTITFLLASDGIFLVRINSFSVPIGVLLVQFFLFLPLLLPGVQLFMSYLQAV